LEQRGIQWQTAAWFGVGYYGGAGFLRGRMVFPIHDEGGELVAYAGRTMDGREPRYLFPPGFRKSQVVFNLHRAVAGCVHGLGAGGLSTRPTVERGDRTDSAQRERRCWSMKMALQFQFG
jgi:hypothetical protein